MVEDMTRVLFVHDNHLSTTNGCGEYKTSTFHLFLLGFNGCSFLSSPCYGWGEMNESIAVDGCTVQLRPAYGKAIDFYKQSPMALWRSYKVLYQHISHADAVVICGPCCSAVLAYMAARRQKKKVVAYFIGNNIDVVAQAYENKGFVMRLAAKAIAWWEWKVMEWIASHHAAVALGEDIYTLVKPKARRIMLGMTSLISDQDIIPPRQIHSDGRLNMLTVGRISSEKGIETAIHAVKKLREIGWDIHYSIIGDGPMRLELQKLIQDLQLQDYISLQGHVTYDEIKRFYDKADFFVLPSITEGVAKVLLEAMAAGIPVIGSKVGGTPGVLGEGARGWLFEAGNTDALVDSLQVCLSDSSDMDRRLMEANAYIAKHTREAMADRLMGFIDGMPPQYDGKV